MVASIIGEIGRPAGDFWEALPDFAIVVQGVLVNEGAKEEALDRQLLHRILAHLPAERPSFESIRSLIDVRVAPTAAQAAVAAGVASHLLITDMMTTVGSCKSHTKKAVLAHGGSGGSWGSDGRRVATSGDSGRPPDMPCSSRSDSAAKAMAVCNL